MLHHKVLILQGFIPVHELTVLLLKHVVEARTWCELLVYVSTRAGHLAVETSFFIPLKFFFQKFSPVISILTVVGAWT